MLLTLVISICTSATILYLLERIRYKKIGLDHPNERSMHTVPRPRTGGLSILAGLSISLFFLSGEEATLILLTLSLGAVSFVDDMVGLPIIVRFISHFFVVIIFLLNSKFGFNAPIFIIAMVIMVWHINLYNFMDGMDGMVATMSIVGFLTFAFFAYSEASYTLCSLTLLVSTSVLPFLCRNFPPASIFMGDSGSISLGFCSVAVSFFGWFEQIWSPFFPVLIFFPFLFDATTTLVKRIITRKNIFQAHNMHYYQRLIKFGWSVRQVWFLYTVVMLLCTAIAVFSQRLTIVYQGLLTLALFFTFMLSSFMFDRNVK